MSKLTATAFAFACMGLCSCGDSRTADRHEIPAEFDGVAVTVFSQPGFPPLPERDGFRVHAYPSDGILITSDPMPEGWASDEVVDILADGTEQLLGNSPSSSSRHIHFSASGSRSTQDLPEIEFLFLAIGKNEFTSASYDLAVENAARKVDRAIKTRSEQNAAGQPATRLESK